MSWWTEVRDTTLSELGLSTPQDVVNTAGAVASAAVGGSEVKKEIPVVQKNYFQMAAEGELSKARVFGVSLPLLAVALGAGYFLLRRR